MEERLHLLVEPAALEDCPDPEFVSRFVNNFQARRVRADRGLFMAKDECLAYQGLELRP